MTDSNRINDVAPESGKDKATEASQKTRLGSIKEAKDEVVDVSKLSKDEQMALFEKQLKEDDWGHQPC